MDGSVKDDSIVNSGIIDMLIYFGSSGARMFSFSHLKSSIARMVLTHDHTLSYLSLTAQWRRFQMVMRRPGSIAKLSRWHVQKVIFIHRSCSHELIELRRHSTARMLR